MGTLRSILMLAVLAYTVYSMIIYYVRRSENKDAFLDLKNNGQAARVMSPEESAAVQPFLVNPAKKNKIASLLSEQVYQIAGEYAQHGISSNRGGEMQHETLGNIDVVLPYDARDFLQPWNTAEVVLTENFAIVLSLNGTFDLKGGRDRAQLQQHQDTQGHAGQTSDLPNTGFLASHPNTESTEENAAQEIAPVHILGQREETAAEAALRDNSGIAWLPALLLIPAFILPLVGSTQESIWLWITPGLLLLAGALFLFWRPFHTAKRRMINRVEGGLDLITLQNPGNSKIVRKQLFLGDKFPIKLPAHWDGMAPTSGVVDIDMRVDDFSVVRLGDKLSLDQEENRHPSVYWRRHLLWAALLAAMLLVAWLTSIYDSKDLAQVRAIVQGGASQTLTNADSVRASPPPIGSMVQISAQARCQIMPGKDGQPGPISCDSLRWGGDALKVADVTLDPALLQFYNGEIVHAKDNVMASMALGMQMAQQGGEYNPLLHPSIYNINNLSELVKIIDKTCRNDKDTPREACEKTQETLGKKLIPGEAEDSIGWEKLLAKANDGSLAKEGDAAITAGNAVEEIRSGLHDMAEPRVRLAYAKALQDTLASQRGGIVLSMPVSPAVSSQADTNEASASAPASEEEVAIESNSTDWLKQWANYQSLAKSDKPKPVALKGMVVHEGKDEYGNLVLEVDPLRNKDNFAPALIRLLTLAIGVLLLLIHGPLGLLNLRKALLRKRLLAEYNQQRLSSVF